MHLHSIAAIADDILDKLPQHSIDTLKETEAIDLPLYHMSWGRGIRNDYKLWEEDHPLTTKWHKFPDQRVLKDGIDMSDDHPDAVSMRVMERVHKKVNS